MRDIVLRVIRFLISYSGIREVSITVDTFGAVSMYVLYADGSRVVVPTEIHLSRSVGTGTRFSVVPQDLFK